MTVRNGKMTVMTKSGEVGWPTTVQKRAVFVNHVVRINKQRKIVSDGQKCTVIAKVLDNG